MACYKVTVTVIDKSPSPGEAGKSWQYTFYTRLNPNDGPPTEGLTPEQQKAEQALRRGMADPLDIVRDPYVPGDRKKKRLPKSCAIKVKKYASNGSWKVSYNPDSNNEEAYQKPTVPYGNIPPWGNLGREDELRYLDYRAESQQVADGTCDQNFTTQAIDDAGDNYQEGSTECQCPLGDSSLGNLPAIGAGLGFRSQTDTETSLTQFITYLEGLRDTCISGSGQKFTMQFACLPKNIVLEPFSFPSGWDTLGDAQKINFLNSKVTLLQQALGNNYYQEISLKTNCLKSAGTIINGHIYKQ